MFRATDESTTLADSLLDGRGARKRLSLSRCSNSARASIVVAVVATAMVLVGARQLVPHFFVPAVATQTVEDANELMANPLLELVARSAARGACDANGKPTGFPMPWSMTLATGGRTGGAAPSIRSIGIQGITAKDVYFVCRGGPGGVAGPPAGLAEYNASLVHLAGNYPLAGFEEQWRAEGVVREVPPGELRVHGLPPPDEELMVQILASASFTEKRARRHSGSLKLSMSEGRVALATGAEAGDAADGTATLAGEVELAGSLARDTRLELARRAGLRVYAFTPRRVEMLHGGPAWPGGPRRFDWVWDGEAGEWYLPRQILPYNEPFADEAPLHDANLASRATPSARTPASVTVTSAPEDHTDVGMQCVSEFNWNQGQQATYQSATGYFVGAGGNVELSSVPDCSGSWTAQDDVLTLNGAKQPRMFLKDGRDQLLMLDMSTEELSWTQNVAELGRDFNGAVYATWVRSEDEGNTANAARLYCDANDGTGNNLWCPEMDLGEANYCGFRSTSHPVTDLNGHAWRSNAVNCYSPLAAEQGAWLDPQTSSLVENQDYTNLFYCGLGVDGAQAVGSPPMQTWVDHYGNALWFTSAAAHAPCSATPENVLCTYGDGQAIDTNRDYDVHIKFHWDGYLRGFTTTLRQGSNTIELTRQTSPNSASVPVQDGFPARMALLVQLWVSRPGSGTEGAESGGSGMSWLSGAACNVSNGDSAGFPAMGDATFTIKDMRITNSITKVQRRVLFRSQK